MKQSLITIGDKSYKCKITETNEERKKGLMDVKFLAPDEAMLFEFSDSDRPTMWMKNTYIALDQIGISEDDEVIQTHTGIPEDETIIPFPGCKYVLEVNANSGIKEGDEFEFDDSDDLDKYSMKVIGSDGGTQFLLQGGERICSRSSTKQLIKWAKKAEASKDNPELFERYCKRLGKRLFREFYDQDHRDAQYVKAPEVKD